MVLRRLPFLTVSDDGDEREVGGSSGVGDDGKWPEKGEGQRLTALYFV